MTEAEKLAALDRAATQGTLIAHGWGDGSTPMGMTNIFNEDAEVLVMECIPEADANFIVALWNAYRANQLVLIGPDAVEDVANAIWGCSFHPVDVASGEAEKRKAEWPRDWDKAKRRATAALAALGVK